MFQISSPISIDIQMPLEEFFCAQETFAWTFFRKDKNSPLFLRGSFKTKELAFKQWAHVRESFPDLSQEADIEEILDEDWQNAYKKYLKPWTSRNLHWVPVWEKDSYVKNDEDVILYFDAGMAFGTGSHETTRLCAERLLDFKEAHASTFSDLTIIDAGCGSGILSISAQMLGAQNVFGFDIDPDTITVCKQNLTFNNLPANSIEFSQADIDQGLTNKSPDLIMANIQADILCNNAEVFIQAIIPKSGTLVLSGILLKERDETKAHFLKVAQASGKKCSFDTRGMGEWCDILITCSE